MEIIETTCCVVGGGPAGMMLAFLLARSGVAVTLLEKHGDFLRDFRGDTVHPSTLEVMHELGLLDDFLQIPHRRLEGANAVVGDFELKVADFTRLPTRCKFIALVPQWDFLNFLAGRGGAFSGFDLRLKYEAVRLIEENGRVSGVVAQTPNGEVAIRAGLVIACDGRHSIMRKEARLPRKEFGVPIDVLWFRISRSDDDAEHLLGNFNYGAALILIPRVDYYQAGLLIRKNSFEDWKAKGLDAFRGLIGNIVPALRPRLGELENWDQIKLLSVQLDRLEQWSRPGLLCIGDAAHAMSPAGGVGINLALQDAIATANILTPALLKGENPDGLLHDVQRRRTFPTVATQFFQKQAHRLLQRAFQQTGPVTAPWQLRAVSRVPGFPFLTGRMIGLGARPEHVADPATARPEPPVLVKTGIVTGTVLGTIVGLATCGRRTSHA